MKQITILGNTYNSISAAWRALSPDTLPMITVRWRLNNGWTPETAFILTAVPAPQRRRFKEFRTF